MVGQELIEYKDLGTYLVDHDAEVEYGDRYILIDKDGSPVIDLYPSHLSSYKKVKVIWYYEKSVSLTNILESLEEEITRTLTEELTREINNEILNRINEGLF